LLVIEYAATKAAGATNVAVIAASDCVNSNRFTTNQAGIPVLIFIVFHHFSGYSDAFILRYRFRSLVLVVVMVVLGSHVVIICLSGSLVIVCLVSGSRCRGSGCCGSSRGSLGVGSGLHFGYGWLKG